MRAVLCFLGFLLVVAVGVVVWWFLGSRHVPREGYYPVGSALEDDRALGGFGPCDNMPKDRADRTWGEAGAVSLLAFPDEPASAGKGDRFALRLINRTERMVPFAACNSCLFLVQEALDRDGNWRPIELVPDSDCGNSFHRVFLGPNQYWETSAPRSEGTFNTRLRFRLEQGDWKPIDDQDADERYAPRGVILPRRGGRVIYSNEFEGSINESQFVNATDE